MGYLALYRRYRPSTFDGVIGQDHIIQTLVNQIKNDRLGHAYLFTGTRGTGKTSIAKIFAKAINCLNPRNGSPCGECEVCKALSDPSNIDVIEIDAASNNGVNEIRDIRENVQYPPVSCRYKVYIVDEVHMLSGAAFNALLKTLEEPPKHVVFILATTEVQKIPATILSRCMRFDFRLVSTETLAKHISSVYDSEKVAYEEEAIYAIAKAGEGSVRDALSIADIAMSFGGKKLTYDDVMNVLGASSEELLYEFIEAIIDSNNGKVFEIIEKMCSLGKSIGVLNKDVNSTIRDLIVVKNCQNPNKILRLPDSRFTKLTEIAEKTDPERLIRMLEIFSDLTNVLKYGNNPRIAFETATLKAAMPKADYDIKAILSRISALEDKIKNGVEIKLPSPNVQTSVKEEKKQRVDLTSLSIDEIKGKLLASLRENGAEMLWNSLQKVDVELMGRVITLVVYDSSDFDFIDRIESKRKIIEALEELMPFELSVKMAKEKVELQEIDDATDRIRKVFGNDIVIIKD